MQQALEQAPDNPAILDTHAMILLARGDHIQALVVNQKILDAAPGHAQFRFHRARILAAAGDSAGAVAILEDLVAGSAFPEQSQARALLGQLQ